MPRKYTSQALQEKAAHRKKHVSSIAVEGDHANIRAIARFLGVPEPTARQSKLIYYYLTTNHVAKSAEMAELNRSRSATYLNTPETRQILKYYRDHVLQSVSISRDTITQMYLEAYANAENAAEQLMAAEKLAKLHGLLDPRTSSGTSVTVNVGTRTDPQSIAAEIKELPDEKLMEMSGNKLDLTPRRISHAGTDRLKCSDFSQEIATEAEFTEPDPE